MSRYLLMIPGLLFLFFAVPTGSNELDRQMEKDTNQEKLTHKETSTWSRMRRVNDQGEEHFHRLYDAYRERWRGEGDEAERGAKANAMESTYLAPIKWDIGPIKKTLVKPENKEKSALPIIKYDATDERSEPSPKCLARFPLRKKEKDLKEKDLKEKDLKEKDKESSDRKESDETKMIYTQSRLPSKNKEKDFKEKDKESPERKLSEENIMIELKKKHKEKPEEKTSPENSMVNLKKSKGKPKEETSPEGAMMDAKNKTSPEGRKKLKEKPEGKASMVSTMTVVKFDLPAKMTKVNSSAKPNLQDEKAQRILELNRIYNEYLKAWQKPSPSDSLKAGTQAKAKSPPGSVRLSALVDLLNVVERFQQSDLVSDLAKKISQEMEPNLTNQINHDANLVTDSRASLKGIIKNDLSGLFENMKPSSASAAFKEILADIKSRRATIKAGGLYDEYKKGFCKIFSDQKYTRQSDHSEDINAIRCDSGKSKNSPSKVSEPAAPAVPSRNKNYLKALETFMKVNRESNENGGSRPYFLPKSKNRQLIHNDIPLIKSGPSDASRKSSDNGAKFKSYKTSNKEKDMPDKETNGKYVPKQDSNKLKEPAPKTESKEPPANPWKDLYSGLDPVHITNGIKAIKNSSFFNLVDEYQKQVENLNQALKTKQGWWKEARTKGKSSYRKSPKRNIHMNNPPAPFPEVLVNQAPQMGVNVLGNMANQMHVSPIEMAQRIVGAGPAPAAPPHMAIPQMQLASQVGGGAVPKGPEFTYNIPCQPPELQQCQQQQQQQQQAGISPVLEKILQRLESIQATKCNQSSEEDEKNLPCCFVDPADGAPCDLNGSWESLVLGVRINIKANTKSDSDQEDKTKPTCVQPKSGRVKHSSSQRLRRQCVKMNPSKLKEMAHMESQTGAGITLNVSVQETVPPRAHDLLDNLTDWQFSGNALMILGGPISLSFRKFNSNLIGHFVGYCRTCGCLDTIFGSWTFCQPSRDCQDIAMSIVDRRDMLRRYSMDERRKNRFKEQLYMSSKFAKMEKERLRQEQVKNELHSSQKPSDPGPK